MSKNLPQTVTKTIRSSGTSKLSELKLTERKT